MLYNVLIQPRPDGKYHATVLGWPDLNAVGDSEQTAVERIRQAMRQCLSQSKVVRIEVDEAPVEVSAASHPWQPFLGMWQDDPTFDDFSAKMDAFRCGLDEAAG